MDPRVAFALLQPTCAKVAKDGDANSVKELRLKLLELLNEEESRYSESNCSFVNDLMEYLLFPLLLIYQKPATRSECLEEELVSVILLVLSHSEICDWSFFEKLFFQMVLVLTSKNNSQKVSSVSEECKETTLKAITTLCKRASLDVYKEVLNPAFRPQLGHAIYICLKLAEHEKSRAIRVCAMETLLSLGCHQSWDDLTVEDQDKISQVFVNFFPGIITTTSKISTASDIQGHKVTSKSIRCFAYYVNIVMRDKFLINHVPFLGLSENYRKLQEKLIIPENNNKNNNKTENLKKSKFDIPTPEDAMSSTTKLKDIKITQKWVETTTKNLSSIVSAMSKLVTHLHWSVRLALVNWADTILTHCSRSLNECIVTALEVAMVLAQDECDEVVQASKKLIKVGKRTFQQPDMHHLWELIEERIFSLATSIVTTAKLQEDKKTLTVLRQLCGCLQVLGNDKVSRLMRRAGHRNRIFGSLIFLFTYNTDDNDVLMEKTFSEDNFDVIEVKPELGKCFKYFLPNSCVYEEGVKVCQIIGSCTSMSEIVSTCLDCLQSPAHLKEMLTILTFMFSGLHKSADEEIVEDREEAVRNILNCIECFLVMELPTKLEISNKNIEDRHINNGALVSVAQTTSTLTIDTVKQNIITVKTSLELLSKVANLLERRFDTFLSKVLWIVLEKAGDNNVMISYSGTCCLKEISNAMKYTTVRDFIQDKVSQFWFALSLRLRRLDEYPSAPLVMKVVLGYGISDEMYSFIDELVEEVLITLDSSRHTVALPLLNILLIYTIAVSKYNKKELNRDMLCITDNEYNENKVACSSLTNFLSNLHENYVTSEKLKNQDSDFKYEPNTEEFRSDDKFDSNCQEEEATKPKVPNYIKLIVDIFEKCSYLLYGKDRDLNLIIINIILNGSSILTTYEDQALPMFHKLWKPLTLLINSDDFVVMLKCLEVCVVLVGCSGDFLRKRTTTDILPKVVSFLSNQSKTSLGKCKETGYHILPAYKAQFKLLYLLPKLALQLELSVLEMIKVVDAFIPYLDLRQPEELRQLAEKGINVLSTSVNREVLWISLASLQPKTKYMPTTSLFKPISIRQTVHQQQIPKVMQDIFSNF